MPQSNVRVVIVGAPKAGKTTLAKSMVDLPVRSTDEIMGLGWSESSDLVARSWLNEPGPWVIEGTAAVRALRKWLDQNPAGKPCDVLYVLTKPLEALSVGQSTMARGVQTILNEIQTELEMRGVAVQHQ